MSIVNVFLYQNFALICGDTMLVRPNGNKAIIRKVLKSTNNIAFGFTGDVQNNIEFFSPFIHDNLEVNESIIVTYSYNKIIETLNKKYEQYISNTDLPPNFCASGVVVGWYNGRFVCNKYRICPTDRKHEIVFPQNPTEMKIVQLGLEKHLTNFFNLFDQSKFTSYRYILEVYQQVLNLGLLIDDTISNTVDYVLLFTE